MFVLNDTFSLLELESKIDLMTMMTMTIFI